MLYSKLHHTHSYGYTSCLHEDEKRDSSSVLQYELDCGRNVPLLVDELGAGCKLVPRIFGLN